MGMFSFYCIYLSFVHVIFGFSCCKPGLGHINDSGIVSGEVF